MPILAISFDGVGDIAYESMAAEAEKYPNIAAFKANGFYRNNVSTVALSSTYPIHATISTGKVPSVHGIISNYIDATRSDSAAPWAQMASLFKHKTLWDAAKDKNLKTAAFLWPVSCGGKIDYHIPEYHKQTGENQVICNLKYGSKFFQLKTFLKHKHLLDGIKQPNLDNFTTTVACDLLATKKIDLMLVHLIAYDDFCHNFGSTGTEPAKKALDENLGRLLNAWGENPVIIFADHSQLDLVEVINLEKLYPNTFTQNGGSAFIKNAKNLEGKTLESQYWFGRFLTEEEMTESGHSAYFSAGITAKVGYSFGEKPMKGEHGYPPSYENYQIFYNTNKKISQTLKGNIRDVTAIIANELQLDMDILDEYGWR
ncbi:MAG: alkaline phosphatase family protein [Firmicutes bacterium]|nr:alkaline phosphatase family protein [Bacillota bacterium]